MYARDVIDLATADPMPLSSDRFSGTISSSSKALFLTYQELSVFSASRYGCTAREAERRLYARIVIALHSYHSRMISSRLLI